MEILIGVITINYVFSLVPFSIVILGLVLIYRRLVINSEEKNLVLKLIGYYLLGGFNFKINMFPIPLGFLANLLFFRPTENLKAKKSAAILGLVAFGFSLIIPALADLYFERPREVILSSNNLYSLDFSRDWQNVQQKLPIPKDSKIEHYSLAYDSNGEIRDIYFEIIAQEQGLVHYRVHFIKSEQVYRINAKKIDQWIQYNRLMQAERFFQLLDTLDLRKIKPEGDFEWFELRSQGSTVTYGIENTQKYVIKQGEITEITNDQLPITGFSLSSYGMKKVKESGNTTAYEGQGMRDYLFDVTLFPH